MTILAVLLPLGGLIVVYLVLARSFGFRFSLTRAMLKPRSFTGQLMAVWLALLAATWTICELAAEWRSQPGDYISASIVVTLLLAALIGLAVAERASLFVLALLGLGAQLFGITREFGPEAAVTLLVITCLVTWLFGLTRGLRTGETSQRK